MRRPLIGIVSFIAVLALGLTSPNPAVGALPSSTPKLAIAKVGPKDNGGEPSIATGPEGNLYVSWPGDHVNLARSTNQGGQWTAGGYPPNVNSVGDTSVNADSSGAVYQTNLNGFEGDENFLQAVVYKSFDFGRTWPQQGQGFANHGNSSNSPALVDRQWADAWIPPGKGTGKARVYLIYHDWGPSQIWINTSTDGGKTFGAPADVITSPAAEAASLCNTIPGGVKVVQTGPHAGRIYVAWLAADAVSSAGTGCNITQLDTFHSVWVARSDDGGATWTDHLAFDGGFGHDASDLFADFTLDNQGNPYLAFGDHLGSEWDMYVEASFDGGRTWNGKTDGTGAPYKVNSDRGTHVFPAIAVGDPGKVDVAYLRTPSVIPTSPYGKPVPGGDPNALWYVYFAQSLNLRSGHPTWTVVKVTPTPMHKGDVCTLGIFCIPGVSNRDLLDFIDVTIGLNGRGHVAYTNDITTKAEGIYAANQTGGPTVGAPVFG